jgi:ABC-type transporter Mla MlaB component
MRVAPPPLPPQLTIYSVTEAARVWQAWLLDDDGQEALALDVAGLSEIDGAGVQWLIALSNTLRQRGRTLQLVAPPAALVTVCRRLGAGFLLDSACSETAA